MAFRPFKPPARKTTIDLTEEVRSDATYDRPSKRQKTTTESGEDVVPIPGPVHQPNEQANTRIPLHQISNPSASPSRTSDDASVTKSIEFPERMYYSVLWRTITTKKNKTWDNDGYLGVYKGRGTLTDINGKILAQSMCSKILADGEIRRIGNREVEIGDKISEEDFKIATNTVMQWEKRKRTASNHSEPAGPAIQPKLTLKEQLQQQIRQEKQSKQATPSKGRVVSVQRAPFKQPLKNNTVLPQVPSEMPIPRHDPKTPGALVFTRPNHAPPGRQVVDVVLDPLLSDRLREHQRTGINFMYECVMGLRGTGGEGCILADDMGLGKTLQTIALLWTLIKQNPIYKAEPVVKKALIVCPVSLIQNWKREFRKWLGRDRVGVLAYEDKGSRLSMFDGKNYKVMIVGYERLRSIAEDLTRGPGIDIVICDEGHRLKTAQNKSSKAIELLNISKRIILSGTPIQNDLSEFFAMASFVNDGVFGSYKTFIRDFEEPIMRSRQPNATQEDVDEGKDASEELAKTTSSFILRRTADVLSNYLPPKTEYVLFCKPTPEQANIYRQVLKSPMFQRALGSSETAFQLITILKKLCNSPALMRPDRGNDESTSQDSLTTLNDMLPAKMARSYDNRFSTKIRLLDELLLRIRTTTDDKVILVSNYTSTLNLMAQLLDVTGGRYLRLDGSVPSAKRLALVDEFNKSPASTYFAFLLSAKAGGTGLNLIGANRLVLFDVDWNPATDDQAMARIHREGQKKPCKIYRFLIKGGLEEKIWQRQVVKRALADSIMDGGSSKTSAVGSGSTNKKDRAAFSQEELRTLFRLDEDDGLRTHDLIACPCNGTGALSRTVLHDDGEADAAENEDGPETWDLPDVASLVKASTLTNASLDKRESLIAQGRHSAKNESPELMSYQHYDTSMVPEQSRSGIVAEGRQTEQIETGLDDDCLWQVLKLDNDVISGRIAYVFTKTTGPEAP